MALEHKDIKSTITPKELKYSDEYLTLTNEYVNATNSFGYFAYKALQDVNDVKSNNFSNLFLTKKQKNSEIVQSSKVEENVLYYNFVSTLSFFSGIDNGFPESGVWLAVDKGYDTAVTDVTTSSIKLVEGKPESYSNYLMHVECVDDLYCVVSHTFGDSTYYLIYDDGFKTSLKPDKGKFIYHIDGKLMRLYYLNNGVPQPICCVNNNGNWSLELGDIDALNDSSIIFINNDLDAIPHQIDATWITYGCENALSFIDTDKSANSLETQFIIHHEYADKNNKVNLIPLKNNLTYQGTATNGGVLEVSNNGKSIQTPQVNYRNYASINSGVNQERGNENIVLTFTFSDQVYRIEAGDECVFTLSEKSETGFGPLYPYETLNVNDSAFVRNGAFASNVPYFADKFKKFQNHNTSPNTYTYHCTWLYQENEMMEPIWLDRYYYPDYLSRKKALDKEFNGFALSFENILDKKYLADTTGETLSQYELEQLDAFARAIKERGYVDKISDLTIEGGTTYKYSRISKDMVKNVYDGIAENRIETVKDQRFNSVNLGEAFDLNGENWRKIPGENFRKSQAINFNTNLYINPRKKMGIQLFGCDYKYGFNIQNRKDLTPFTYYASRNCVYMLNNTFQECNHLDIKEKYGVEIEYIVISAPFDDLYLFTSDALFILDYDLRLKSEIQLNTILANGELDADELKSKIYKTHIILHNKNLYAVIDNTDILKIIVNPENEADAAALKDYYISSRILGHEEYMTNFNMVQNNSLSQTAHLIKSIFIADGNLYALNYDIIKMTNDGDNIYGIIKEESTISSDWYYIFNQSLGKIYTDSFASKYAEFSSDVSIDSIAYGPNGYFGLVRGFNTSDSDKALEIYDRSKTKIYNYPLNNYDELISFDYYRYIDSAFEEHDVFVVLTVMGDFLVAVEYQLDKEKVVTHTTSIKADRLKTFRHIIDSNSFMNKLDENKLYFNLCLEENKLPITYEWDLKEAQEGWYNINAEVDTDNAVFTIKINDIEVASFSNDTNPEFLKHQHPAQIIFDSTYYLGVVGKKYGTILSEILNSGFAFDPYAMRNTKLENTTLYNKTLSYYEYQANRLMFSKINPLALTLPCGIRNGIEEIIRYFKFAKPGSTSNKVKINISGLDSLLYKEEIENLKQNIIDSLTKVDYLTTVKEIEFI